MVVQNCGNVGFSFEVETSKTAELVSYERYGAKVCLWDQLRQTAVSLAKRGVKILVQVLENGEVLGESSGQIRPQLHEEVAQKVALIIPFVDLQRMVVF